MPTLEQAALETLPQMLMMRLKSGFLMQLVSNHEYQNKPQVTTVCFKLSANVE